MNNDLVKLDALLSYTLNVRPNVDDLPPMNKGGGGGMLKELTKNKFKKILQFYQGS